MNHTILFVNFPAIIAKVHLAFSYLSKSHNKKALLKEQPAIRIPEDSKNKLTDNLFCKNRCERECFRPVVVVVESSNKYRNYLIKNLSEDYTVISFREGNEALAFINKKHPDLVLCSPELSGMSSIEFSSRLKTSYKTGGIPVIILAPNCENDKHFERRASLADIFKYDSYTIDEIKADISTLILNNRTLHQTLLQNLFGENFINMDAEKILRAENLNFIYKVKDYVLEHLAENLTREDIASYLCMSSSGFYQKWVSITGEAPSFFIERIKMEKAMEFLKSGLYKINEIPTLIGLSNEKYFRNRFKKHFSMTPTEALRRSTAKVDLQTIEI